MSAERSFVCSAAKFFKGAKNLSWIDDPDNIKVRENSDLRFAVGEVCAFSEQ